MPPEDPSVIDMIPRHWCRTLIQYWYAFGAMGRPLFLLGTLPLYLLGTAAAWHDGHTLRPSVLVLGLSLVWLIQLMTHYNNEYCDVETDLATGFSTLISGGSRVLVRGLVSRRVARLATACSLLLAFAVAITLVTVLDVGSLVMAFFVAAALLGWFYSAPPLKLASRGLGEIAIVLLACFLLPSTAYYLQTSALSLTILPTCVPLALLTFALTLATELPDIAADRATGKITLVARMGINRAMWFQGVSFVVGWLLLATVMAYFWPLWGLPVTGGTVPLAVIILASVRASSKGNIAAMERMGLAHSIVLGYAALAVSIALLIG